MKQTSSNISTLLSGKIDKDEHPTGKEILHSNQSKKKTQKAQLIYSPLRNVLEKKWKDKNKNK